MPYYNIGHTTAAANTAIVAVIPPLANKIAVLRSLVYDCAGTEHDLFVMRCRGTTTTSSFTAAGDTTMEIAKNDPGETSANVDEVLAASDYVAYETEYGNVEVRSVSSISGSTLTLASGPTDDVSEGAKVYAFYEAATTNIGAVYLRMKASTIFNADVHIQNGIPHQDGVQQTVSGINVPLLLVSDNVTAQGFIDSAAFEYIDASHDFSK